MLYITATSDDTTTILNDNSSGVSTVDQVTGATDGEVLSTYAVMMMMMMIGLCIPSTIILYQHSFNSLSLSLSVCLFLLSPHSSLCRSSLCSASSSLVPLPRLCCILTQDTPSNVTCDCPYVRVKTLSLS